MVASSGSVMISALRNGPMRVIEMGGVSTAMVRPVTLYRQREPAGGLREYQFRWRAGDANSRRRQLQYQDSRRNRHRPAPTRDQRTAVLSIGSERKDNPDAQSRGRARRRSGQAETPRWRGARQPALSMPISADDRQQRIVNRSGRDRDGPASRPCSPNTTPGNTRRPEASALARRNMQPAAAAATASRS